LAPVLTAALLGLLLAGTARSVEISVGHMVASIPRMTGFLGKILVMPDWRYLPELGLKLLETLEMTFMATVLAALVSLPLSFLAARNTSPAPAVFHAARGVLSLTRALPEMVWALVFVSALGLGPLPGIMALTFVTIGFMTKFFAEALEVVDARPVDGVAAHGAGWLQVRTFAYLPQAWPDCVGSVMYILDHNLRAATLLGLVGAGGIGYDMIMSMRLFDYNRLVLIAVAVYLMVTLLDRISDRFRARLA
jgi:phosphonate transport system permease protein